jgi:4-amino-4-deoxy-L-arabinose transferase-like glycosyltransferase
MMSKAFAANSATPQGKSASEMQFDLKNELRDEIVTSVSSPAAVVDRSHLDIVLAFLSASIFVTSILIWFSFDHRIPTQDEGVHILNGIAYSELLAHSHPWQYHWWYQCFTISNFYPPFIYLVNGAFLLIFGQSRLPEQACAAFFSGLMLLALYALIRLLNGGRIAAFAGGIFLCAYPAVDWFSHTYFLDLPAVAMMTCALVAFLWSRRSSRPSLGRIVVTGLIIGAAFLSKPTVLLYVLSAIAYFVIIDLVIAFSQKEPLGSTERFGRLLHTVAVLMIAALVSLPFYAVSLGVYHRWLATNVASFASIGVHHSFFGNLSAYLGSLPLVMSPILLAVFATSFLLFRSQEYRNLLPVIVSTIGGLFLTCTSTGTDLEMRYFLPFLIAPAIFSAFLVEKLIHSTGAVRPIAGFAAVLLAICSYVSFNFFPYPVPLSPLPGMSGLVKKSDGNPTPYGYEQWGYPFVLETIDKIDGGKAVVLNILPNHEALHTSAFQLFLCEQKHIWIFPTNSRPCTIIGDRVSFDPITACYPMWYLRKTGYTGFQLADPQSASAYAKLIDFIANSGKYRLIATKQLPDDSKLMLYRRYSF